MFIIKRNEEEILKIDDLTLYGVKGNKIKQLLERLNKLGLSMMLAKTGKTLEEMQELFAQNDSAETDLQSSLVELNGQIQMTKAALENDPTPEQKAELEVKMQELNAKRMQMGIQLVGKSKEFNRMMTAYYVNSSPEIEGMEDAVLDKKEQILKAFFELKGIDFEETEKKLSVKDQEDLIMKIGSDNEVKMDFLSAILAL
jgi:hypothetical protein